MGKGDGKYYISSGADKIADKLANLNPAALERVVVDTTFQAQEMLVEKITNDIEPHLGMHRKNNPQPIVTDLVDTGAYRASWTVSFPKPFTGRLFSNSEYAMALEYGTRYRAGFFPARDTSEKIRTIFKENMIKKLKELLR